MDSETLGRRPHGGAATTASLASASRTCSASGRLSPAPSYSYVGLPLTPLLLGRNPVLLSALPREHRIDGCNRVVFVRVGRVPLLLALIAPIPISMLTDPFFFWAGKRYGRSIIQTT